MCEPKSSKTAARSFSNNTSESRRYRISSQVAKTGCWKTQVAYDYPSHGDDISMRFRTVPCPIMPLPVAGQQSKHAIWQFAKSPIRQC